MRFNKITYNPFRGFVVDDLKVYDDKKRTNELIKISQVVFEVELSSISEKKFSLNSVYLDNARVKIFDANKKSYIELDKISSRMILYDDKIELVKAECEFHGIKIKSSGVITLNKNTRKKIISKIEQEKDYSSESKLGSEIPNKTSIEKFKNYYKKQIWSDVAKGIVKVLNKIEFVRGKEPILELYITGNLSDKDSIRADIRLSSREIFIDNEKVYDIDISGNYELGILDIKKLNFKDVGGSFNSVFRLERNKIIHFNIMSNSKIIKYIKYLIGSERLNQILFYTPPSFKMQGYYDFNRKFSKTNYPLKASGELNFKKIGSRGKFFNSLSSKFSIDHDSIYIKDLIISDNRGNISLSFLKKKDGLKFESVIKSGYENYLPFIPSTGLSKFLKKINLSKNSTVLVRLNGETNTLDFKKMIIEGTALVSGGFKYKGVDFDHFESKLNLKEKEIVMQNAIMRREKGAIRSDFIYIDRKNKITKIENCSGSINPSEFFKIINSKIASHISRYKFPKNPYLHIDGDINLTDHKKNNLNINYTSDDVGYATLLKKTFPIKSPKGTISFDGTDVTVGVKGSLFGGNIQSEFYFPNFYQKKKYIIANLNADSVNLDDFLGLFQNHKKTGGKLNSNFEITAELGNISSLSGQGNVEVRNGNFYSFPILGPLSYIIKSTIPIKDLSYIKFKEASLDFDIKNGIFSTDNFLAKSKGLRIYGNGDLDFTNNFDLDFDARLNFSGLPGIPLLIVSKLFEYTTTGTLSDPKWKYKAFRIFKKKD